MTRGSGRGRVALLLALATVTAWTGAGITAPPATAEPAPGVTVLPAAPRFSPRATSVLNAGETGYLLAQEDDTRLLWIDYATGAATPLATGLPEKPRYDQESGYWDPYQNLPIHGGGHYGAGSDTVALHSASPTPHVTLQKGAGAVFADIVLPDGQSYVGTFGDTVLTRTGEASAPTGYHLLRHGASGVTDTPVSGFPEGAVLGGLEDGDAKSLVLRYQESAESSTRRWRLVDLADGVAKPLPDRPFPEDPWEVSGFRLSAGSILRLRSGRGIAELLDRAAPETVIRSFGTWSFSYDATFAVVGTSLLAVNRQNAGDGEYRGSGLWRIEGEDGGIEPVLELARHEVVVTPDGTALVAGATTAAPQGDIDWAVHRITPSATGDGLETRRLTTIAPMPAHVYGLSLGSGILTTAQDSTLFQPHTNIGAYRSTWLTTTGPPQAVRTTVDGLVGGRDGDCGTLTDRCVVMWASGDGSHGRRDATEQGVTMLRRNGEETWGPRVTTGTHSPDLTDLSGRFGVVTSPSGSAQYTVEFKGADSGTVLEKRDKVASAVWGSTLWSATANTGTITSKSLHSGTAGESFTTTTSCVPSELQAVGRWVYWKCADDWSGTRGSGVHDRQTKRSWKAPDGAVMLGDGYLVHRGEETGLRLYDLHGGLPVSGATDDVPRRTLVTAADLGDSIGRRTGWTVDRFGGQVAYVGDDERVRIVPTGVPAPALSVIDSAVTGTALDLATAGARWSGVWWTSKPTGAWRLTVTEAGSGAVVRTVSGTEARGRVEAAWDGRNSAGQVVRNGSYAWSLTAAPADGVGGELTVGGSVKITGGALVPQPAWRDFSGDKKGDLIALTSAGALTVRTGTGTGSLATGATASGWPTSSTVVPFGDLSGDGCNDLLVRDAKGVLTRQDGSCGKALAPSGPKRVIGGGWQIYHQLSVPGDLTGDARTDLLARTPAGELFLYADNGTGSFAPRVRVGHGWQVYNTVVGTGDLNGDKAGDLLARDTAGVLWRYSGTAKGTPGTRVKVGGGWQIYDSVVGVGDFTGDGKADLVARDTAGVLWRYAGNGAGAFAGRVRIGGGWQMYRTLS